VQGVEDMRGCPKKSEISEISSKSEGKESVFTVKFGATPFLWLKMPVREKVKNEVRLLGQPFF